MQLVVFCLAILTAIGLLSGRNAGVALMFALPVGVGLCIGYYRDLSTISHWVFALSVLVGILTALVVADVSGLLCAIIGFCLTGIPLLLGAAMGRALRRRVELRAGLAAGLHIAMVTLVPLGVLGLERLYEETPRPETLVASAGIDASRAELWGRLLAFQNVEGTRPWLMRLGLPAPVGVDAVAQKVGDRITCRFDDGHLVSEVVEFDAGRRLAYVVEEQRGIEDGSVILLDGSFELADTADGRSRLTLSTRYIPRLTPRWYWRPVEVRLAQGLYGFMFHALDREVERPTVPNMKEMPAAQTDAQLLCRMRAVRERTSS